MNETKQTLVCIMGRSGSGKSTFAKHLVDIGVAIDFPSYTTRAPREGEVDGKDHIFITDEKADKLLKNEGDVLAFYQRGGIRYFTLKSSLPKTNKPIVYVINPNAFMELKDKFKDDKSMNIIGIYFELSLDAQLQNLKNRNDVQADIDKRLSEEDEEFSKFVNNGITSHAYSSNKKNAFEIVNAYNENVDVFLEDSTKYFYSILIAHGLYQIPQPDQLYKNEYCEEKSWEEFRDTGLLFLVNQFLHAFGWAITLQSERDENKNIVVKRAFPARVKFRGFDRANSDKGYFRVSKYMRDYGSEIYSETYDSVNEEKK